VFGVEKEPRITLPPDLVLSGDIAWETNQLRIAVPEDLAPAHYLITLEVSVTDDVERATSFRVEVPYEHR